jgi:hypothetical protein
MDNYTLLQDMSDTLGTVGDMINHILNDCRTNEVHHVIQTIDCLYLISDYIQCLSERIIHISHNVQRNEQKHTTEGETV